MTEEHEPGDEPSSNDVHDGKDESIAMAAMMIATEIYEAIKRKDPAMAAEITKAIRGLSDHKLGKSYPMAVNLAKIIVDGMDSDDGK